MNDWIAKPNGARRALALMMASLIHWAASAGTIWYDTVGPAFSPSVPSTASGPVSYDYEFVGGADGAVFFPAWTWVDGYTYDHGVRSGVTVQERGSGARLTHAIRQHCQDGTLSATSDSFALNDPDFSSAISQAEADYLKWAPQPNRVTLTGPGILPGSWIESGSYAYNLSDISGCGSPVLWGYIQGVWYKVHLELAQGASPPSLGGIGSAVGGGYGPSFVTIRKLNDAGDNYYGGVYNGSFRITRCFDISTAITVNFTKSGSAVAGVDYVNPGSSVTLAAGVSTVVISIVPYYDPWDPTETVNFCLAPGANYVVSTGPTPCDASGSSCATLNIYN